MKKDKMKRLRFLLSFSVSLYRFTGVIQAAPLYYSFTGIVNYTQYTYDQIPPWIEDDPNYFISGQLVFYKGPDFGSILHVVAIDRQRPATITDSAGVVRQPFLGSPTDIFSYADYLWGSLSIGATTEGFLAENSYLRERVDDGSVEADIRVSYGDHFLELYSSDFPAHPDAFMGWVVGCVFEGNDNNLYMISGISETAPIPEPISMLLFGTGIFGIGGYVMEVESLIQ